MAPTACAHIPHPSISRNLKRTRTRPHALPTAHAESAQQPMRTGLSEAAALKLQEQRAAAPIWWLGHAGSHAPGPERVGAGGAGKAPRISLAAIPIARSYPDVAAHLHQLEVASSWCGAAQASIESSSRSPASSRLLCLCPSSMLPTPQQPSPLYTLHHSTGHSPPCARSSALWAG